jgi:ABC-type transport system involved in multi-copper enzyme maturation permease subunit
MSSSPTFAAGTEALMFCKILAFEIKYWLKSWMLWIFFLVIGVLFFLVATNEHVTVGDAIGNTNHNAPYLIQYFYAIAGFFTALMTTAFVNSAAARDFSLNTHQILFSTPIKRFDFLLGRFLGAMFVSIIPMLAVSVAMLLAKVAPWVDAERFGPIIWKAHLYAVLVFAVPNTFLFAAILFAIAVLVRNEIASFVGALILLVGYGVADGLLQNLDRAEFGALLDPFGIRAFSYATKYWTVADRNSLSLGLSGMMLWNRLLWLTLGVAVFVFAYYRFSFAEKTTKAKTPANASTVAPQPLRPLPQVTFQPNTFQRYLSSIRIHFLGVINSTVFIVIALLSLANCVPVMILNANQFYGNSTFPVTYAMVELIQGSFYFFLISLITYYAGVLVWKDRDTRMDEIIDATPTPEWVSYASRLTSLAGVVLILLAIVSLAAVVVQTAYGYHRYQIALYATAIFVRSGSYFLFLAILAFAIHVLAPNKYVGYFVYIVFLIMNWLIWRPLNIASNLIQFGARTRVIYSDFFGDAPFRLAYR